MSRDILQSIIDDFQVDGFNKFFRTKNRSFAPRTEELRQYDDDSFRNSLKLGEIDFTKEGQQLVICAFESLKSLSERSGKKAQYEKGKKLLKQLQADAGIFVFYDGNGNFRFSLIYANYLGKKRDWSTFRRFTYFVSPELTNKTFLQRIGDGEFVSLASIKESFNVEKVTSKFFEEFRYYFEKTKKEFEKSNKNTVCAWLKDKYSDEEYKEQINKFAYTFLGRIIFVYFLQRKGWIENETNYLRKFIKKENNTLLYLHFLQPLFFDVFAKKEKDRPLKIKKQYKDTPYLNGGLFEKSEFENKLAKDGKFIIFENKFIRDIILKFFDNYNFTIDENSPDDQEVSIDPEMLGKVFENTLAEEERGKKGTFYTPREVVHFMVKDSLWQYLKNETEINDNYLHQLIYAEKEVEDIGLSKEQIRLIDKKLEDIKVLDPAVGSAAFPVEMMQVLVDLRERLNVNIGKNVNEVSLKKQFIKNNLYGVDIDAGAIEIAKLRLWLALIVDYKKSEAEPLPNLDFQFRLGNSLQEKIDDIDIFNDTAGRNLFSSMSEYDKLKEKMISVKSKFYDSDNETDKHSLKKEFDNLEHKLIQAVLKEYGKQFKSQLGNVNTLVKGQKNIKKQKAIDNTVQKIINLEQKISDGTYKLFKPDFHFSEVFDRKGKNDNKTGGFDIVIGNPPYGVKVEDDIKKWHGLGNKDSYGVFISTSLKRFLKPGGVLSFIVSDTWLTIKTHKPLREQVLEKQLHKIIRVHQDCFDATVNACIISLTNLPDKNDKLITADFTNISTRKEIEDIRIKLYQLKEFIGQSTPKYAVYEYNRNIIQSNYNLPIFVGSLTLYDYLNTTQSKLIDHGEPEQGIGTGDNYYYLRKDCEARGNYLLINQKEVLTQNNINKFTESDKLKGVDITKTNGRKYLVYDKGGASDIKLGWLPQYYVKTGYYINWSKESVKRLYSATIKDCKIRRKESGQKVENIRSKDDSIRAAWLPEPENWFKDGIVFSRTGQYAPTFRIKSPGPFDNKSDAIITNSPFLLLGVLNSKLCKYFLKNYLCHTVQAEKDAIEEIPVTICEPYSTNIKGYVLNIIEKQKQNPRYDYMSNEQKKIDKLVYEMYGLNKDDIREVETWYARRYPKLARFCDID